MSYTLLAYNGSIKLENHGNFNYFNEVQDKFEEIKNIYMENFNYEIGTTDYDNEVEIFTFNSRIEEIK